METGRRTYRRPKVSEAHPIFDNMTEEQSTFLYLCWDYVLITPTEFENPK